MIDTRKILVAGALAAMCFATAAQAANEKPRLFFEGDMVRGITKAGLTGPICVLTSQYKRGEEIVWRVRVRDRSGKEIDNKGLKSLIVQLPDGQKIPMEFAGHPNRGPASDHFWAGSWAVPADYPTGTFAYTVIATDTHGKTTSWQPFNVGLSQLTVIAGDITPPAPPAPPAAK